MFVITTVADTVRIPPEMFAQPTLTSVHSEIEKRYPNRVIMDVGLVICRYGDALQIGDGVCVAGDGAAHHEVIFRLIMFRPFVEEVCVGNLIESNEEGIRVSLGDFFDDIFVPAYWMLRPSEFDANTGLWIWSPDYDDDENDGENKCCQGEEDDADIKKEVQEEESNRYEMVIGSRIRFKVKAINFTQITNTAKGVQATTTTTASQKSSYTESSLGAPAGVETTTNEDGGLVRKRSSSIDLSNSNRLPSSMHILASICEDGLGLVSWWSNEEEEGEEDEVYME
mmetsp:Transcript_5694/g.8257  ORF Transcript_5694/g.8257 Transcript_5694/m.8257 type:complete len:283 (-) Transcript_5694:378-1226(-)|eukprot:CAMPEP_0184869234 /NCGR_PEP_ID=MMETSP0580-20130426/33455_1 /TAXON_ID=1118495 /ORGANISM="Dactyliosolen fragilissimus" /LENGTH=282 /DNA_ID=CAMNT_0027370597 /DNA_START=29 /DNA_END=877 /DNA_ORIENTATION=+